MNLGIWTFLETRLKESTDILKSYKDPYGILKNTNYVP